MKRIIGIIVCFLLCFGFAVSETNLLNANSEYKNSVTEFASSASSLGGSSYLGISYDPFGFDTVGLTINFQVLGVWRSEISGGISLKRSVHPWFSINCLNFVWDFDITDTIAWGVGFGIPFVFDILSESTYFELATGFNPYGEINFNFFTNSDFGLMLYIRPGFMWDVGDILFEKDYKSTGFTCAIGAAVRMPGVSLADILQGL